MMRQNCEGAMTDLRHFPGDFVRKSFIFGGVVGEIAKT